MTAKADKRQRVGVVGLGNMGSALADALIAAGHDVTVWNRSAGKTQRFADAGNSVAESVAALAKRADVLVVCLFDHAANLDAVLTEDVGVALSGKTLIQLSHVDTDSLPQYQAWAEGYDIALLKGLIFVYPDDIRSGNGTVVYGGPRAVYDSVRPLLQAMGGRPVWAGSPIDASNAVGAAYSCVLFPAVVGFLNGAAVCHRAGIDVATFNENIIAPLLTGPVLKGVIDGLAKAAGSRRYRDDLQATLDAWNHDLDLAIDTIERHGVEKGLMGAIAEQFDRTIVAGHGGDDLASVFETLIATGRSVDQDG
jgi:3-hydroxyisobutyrate dehydrogenase-like beta-hydroxyacid dehydrogenase